MTRCPRCESTDVVEVDNPLRREVRHRRGVTCPGRPPEVPPSVAEMLTRARPRPTTEIRASDLTSLATPEDLRGDR